MRDSGMVAAARRNFIVAWVLLCAVKLALAVELPLFVDEAFYWQEGQHLAWAYSDLPGLTAWLARLGVDAFGQHALGLRLPFLLIGAAIPWLLVRMTAREFGTEAGWQAGLLALLLPLAGTLGLLALPDVPLLLASVLCLDAGLRLLRGVGWGGVLELGLGLAMGGLCHYRFAAVIAVGFVVLLLLKDGRQALRDWRVWAAIGVGALAWLPLLLWNLHNADAGLRFQLVDRHPWRFGSDGFALGLMQLLATTPLLLAAMWVAMRRGLRGVQPAARWLSLCGALIVAGFLVLGFFADRERVSFHWPLPGFVALLPLLPGVLAGWSRAWRIATLATTALGLAGMLCFFAMAADFGTRALGTWYPASFAGWTELDAAVRSRLAAMPPGTRLLAGDFKIGAELGFARNDADIAVLDHMQNHHHGRAPQLLLWGLQQDARIAVPTLLVVSPTHSSFREQLDYYRQLCRQVGPLPPPQTLNVRHGRERFLLFALPAAAGTGSCVPPALAYLDAPAADARVGTAFEVAGWAFKDGVGLQAVDILLDGAPVARADYGLPAPGLAEFWNSRDPQQPNLYFRARLQDIAPGTHWLGLRLHGRDGSVEDWSEQRICVEKCGWFAP